MAREPVEAPTRNPAGADVGERLRVIHLRILMRYHEPSSRLRRRRERIYPREDQAIERAFLINVGCEALDPDHGAEMVATQVAQGLYKRLVYEGFPRKFRDFPGDRPGA